MIVWVSHLTQVLLGFNIDPSITNACVFYHIGMTSHSSESRAALFNLQIDYDTLQDKYSELSKMHDRLLSELENYKDKYSTTAHDLGKSKVILNEILLLACLAFLADIMLIRIGTCLLAVFFSVILTCLFPVGFDKNSV